MNNSLYIAITTVSSKEEATKLANLSITKQMAACVQIEGPIESHYYWNETVCTDIEFRISFKTTHKALESLEKLVFKEHIYDTPQWIVIKTEKVEGKYLKWCEQACSVRRLI